MDHHRRSMLDATLERLGREKGNLREIAKATGVPYSTLAKISSGAVTDPRVSTVQALHDYFDGRPKRATESAS
ncbi:helix-turn-helix transcriptional regulator [Burkholderia sp. Bp9142]|uniref:helix-turn-helix domain-containing protein n=1 Tax=Burkholderia sp. Bp9142 TaxID=2184573 RepID=UPI000F58FB76|nr:helix-turn-helix domain-containing protein [Burkholderia sp. Bp9142]RQR37838.1 helix-turn-helix domain-containing protein [Burkholderia sp. Bp9142]